MERRPRPSLPRALWKALRLRCPYCHRGKLFRGWPNRMFRHCPNCGLPYLRESGFYLGGMILTYIFTTFAVLAIFTVSLLLPGFGLTEGTEGLLWLTLAVLLTVVFVRPAYSLWLAIDFWISPWAPAEGGKTDNRDSAT